MNSEAAASDNVGSQAPSPEDPRPEDLRRVVDDLETEVAELERVLDEGRGPQAGGIVQGPPGHHA